MKATKSPVRVGRSHVGRGVYATTSFRRYELIGEVTGRLVSWEKADPRYCVDYDAWGYLAPNPPYRFLNHSCEPNCTLVQWEDETRLDGSPRLWVEARRAIRPGDELTIDYAWPAEDEPLLCRCGARNCRGFIVDKKQLKTQLELLRGSAA